MVRSEIEKGGRKVSEERTRRVLPETKLTRDLEAVDGENGKNSSRLRRVNEFVGMPDERIEEGDKRSEETWRRRPFDQLELSFTTQKLRQTYQAAL